MQFASLDQFLNRTIIDVWADAPTFEEAYAQLAALDSNTYNKHIV